MSVFRPCLIQRDWVSWSSGRRAVQAARMGGKGAGRSPGVSLHARGGGTAGVPCYLRLPSSSLPASSLLHPNKCQRSQTPVQTHHYILEGRRNGVTSLGAARTQGPQLQGASVTTRWTSFRHAGPEHQLLGQTCPRVVKHNP